MTLTYGGVGFLKVYTFAYIWPDVWRSQSVYGCSKRLRIAINNRQISSVKLCASVFDSSLCARLSTVAGGPSFSNQFPITSVGKRARALRGRRTAHRARSRRICPRLRLRSSPSLSLSLSPPPCLYLRRTVANQTASDSGRLPRSQTSSSRRYKCRIWQNFSPT